MTTTKGDGFVMVNHPAGNREEITLKAVETSTETLAGFANGNQPREAWAGIEDDVRELERLLL